MEPPLTRRQAVAVRAALVVLVAGVVVGELGSSRAPSTSVVVLDAVLGAAAALAAPAAHRRPVAGALVLVGLSLLTPTATPVAATALLWVAASQRLSIAVGTAVAAVAAQGLRGLWRPDLGLPTGWWLLVVALAYAALVGWGAWAQARRALLASVVDRTRQAERTRIAREVHDTLAHRLSLVATMAGALEYNRDAGPERTAEAAGAIRTSAHQALEELREVVGLLRDGSAGDDPGRGRPQPDVGDVGALVDESRAAGGAVVLDDEVATGHRARLPAGLGRTAYRVVQEGLTNARKHAPDQEVRVTVRGCPGGVLEVEVVNRTGPDRPSPSVPGAGAGLVGLRERVELSGGRLDHGAVPSGDFRLAASLPWPR